MLIQYEKLYKFEERKDNDARNNMINSICPFQIIVQIIIN